MEYWESQENSVRASSRGGLMANGHVGDLRFGWSEAVQDEVTRDDGGEPANSEHIR